MKFLFRQGIIPIVLVFLCVAGSNSALARSNEPPPPPDAETDPLVLEKLEWFQDVKFGLLMHWGPPDYDYSKLR